VHGNSQARLRSFAHPVTKLINKQIVIVIAACLACSLAQAADLSGVPRIVDGDTLAIGATKVRLEGIDAPETDQVCLNANGDHWACGIEARDQLAEHIGGREIRCSSNDIDAYRRTLATCYFGDEDLNGWMVQRGWALAYVKYSSAYRQAEEEARTNQRGLWQGAFIAPWDWRHRNNKTVILGAFSVPIDAQAILLGPSATEGAPSPECTIKGNVNRNGERIYHTEHQSSYAKIRMDKGSGIRWFCTPEEAEAAGWRRSVR
jgi:endonuclease YncB( thermonuclease family)